MEHLGTRGDVSYQVNPEHVLTGKKHGLWTSHGAGVPAVVSFWEEKGRLSGEGKKCRALGVTQRGGGRETVEDRSLERVTVPERRIIKFSGW